MPKGFFRGKRLQSRRFWSGHKRSSADTGKGDKEPNTRLQLVIVATLAILALAVLVAAFAVSMVDTAHADEVWSASERIITIVITGLFATIGNGFIRH